MRTALEQWDRVMPSDCFQHFGGLDIEQCWDRPWRWMRNLIIGLYEIETSRLRGSVNMKE